MNPLTPPMSNDDENKRPSANKSSKTPSTDKEKKGQVQYRILQRGQPDEPTVATTPKKLQQESNTPESSKSQRNRRRAERKAMGTTSSQPFSNLTNNNSSSQTVNSQSFRYNGPRCWKQFRLNRSEIVRCLRE